MNNKDSEDHNIVNSLYDIDTRRTGRCGHLHKGTPIFMVQGDRIVATPSVCMCVCVCV